MESSKDFINMELTWSCLIVVGKEPIDRKRLKIGGGDWGYNLLERMGRIVIK